MSSVGRSGDISIEKIPEESRGVLQDPHQRHSECKAFAFDRPAASNCHVLVQETDETTRSPRSGTFFGNKDHTTVMFACRKIAEKIEEDEEIARHRSNIGRITAVSGGRTPRNENNPLGSVKPWS